MQFDFLSTKKAARQALHETLAVSSNHISAATGVETPCRVRVHTKIKLVGDIDYQGYAELSDGVVLIHFEKAEARRLNVSSSDKIVYDGKTYQLQTQRDDDGIFLETWYANHLDG